MIFQSKIKRQWIRQLILGVLADIVMAGCITVLVTVYDLWFGHWALALVLIFLALQVFGIAAQIIHGTLNWITFRVYDRKNMKETFLSMIRGIKLPRPDEYEDSPEQYIANVVNNAECAIDIRLGAASLHGQLRAYSK